MKLIGVKEFASQSSWKELSASLLVHDYTCNGCLSTTDVDLCRDPSLQSEEPSCQHCHTEYDMELIERRLIAMLQNLVDSYGFVAHVHLARLVLVTVNFTHSLCSPSIRRYLVTDLICVKCGNANAEHLRKACQCCGATDLKSMRPLQEVESELRTMGNVARMQNMTVLDSMVQDVLRSM